MKRIFITASGIEYWITIESEVLRYFPMFDQWSSATFVEQHPARRERLDDERRRVLDTIDIVDGAA